MSNLSDYIGAGASGLLADATTLTDVTGTQTLDFSNNGAYIVTQGAGALTLNISSETDARNEGVLILTRNPNFSITFGANVFDVADLIETFAVEAGSTLTLDAANTGATSLTFNNDGSRLFVADTDESVYQYNLSTNYDITTAVYSGDSYSFTSQISTLYSVRFSSDGLTMFAFGDSAQVGEEETIFQYSLTTPFDLSAGNVTYGTIREDLTDISPLSSGRAFIFNNDGTKAYAAQSSFNTIFQYSLSTAYTIGTISYDSVSINVSILIGFAIAGVDFSFNADGSVLYLLNGSRRIYELNLPTAYDISTATYSGANYVLTSEGTTDPSPTAFTFNDGFSEFYVAYNADNKVLNYLISPPSKSTVQVHGDYKSIIADYIV